jgi:hypothetical protein
MSVELNVYNVISIEPQVREFDSFTLYRYVVIDGNGRQTSIDLYHRHENALLMKPRTYEYCGSKTNADV